MNEISNRCIFEINGLAKQRIEIYSTTMSQDPCNGNDGNTSKAS